MLLDEIDKLCADSPRRSGPRRCSRSWIPEQNSTFRDLTPGRALRSVVGVVYRYRKQRRADPPGAARSAKEIFFELSGYTQEEKLTIATRYLVPRAIVAAGLSPTYKGLPDHRPGTAFAYQRLHPRSRRARPRSPDRRAMPQAGPQGRDQRGPVPEPIQGLLLDLLVPSHGQQHLLNLGAQRVPLPPILPPSCQVLSVNRNRPQAGRWARRRWRDLPSIRRPSRHRLGCAWAWPGRPRAAKS